MASTVRVVVRVVVGKFHLKEVLYLLSFGKFKTLLMQEEVYIYQKFQAHE